MKSIRLTQNKITLVDNEDFKELNEFSWYYHQGRACRKPHKVKGKRKGFIWMHREIMKPSIDMTVDHLNGDALDNRKQNLRVCTKSQNQWNAKIRKDSSTGVKGVTFHKIKKKFIARIQVKGERIIIGNFNTLEEARDSIIKARQSYHGEYSRNK